MICEKCGGKTRVKDTASDDFAVIRQRICKECGYIFCTVENEGDYNACLEKINHLRNKKVKKRRKKND